MSAISKSVHILGTLKLTLSAAEDSAGLLPPLRVLSDIV